MSSNKRVLVDISNSTPTLKADEPQKNDVGDKKPAALTENSATTNVPDGKKKSIKPKKGVSFAASE
jgi:hypothetical protein